MLSCDENAISVPLAPVSSALAETACVSYIDPTIGRPDLIAPAQVNQRRYEALRAYYTEDLTLAAAGERFGHTVSTGASLVRDFHGGRLELFTRRASLAARALRPPTAFRTCIGRPS